MININLKNAVAYKDMNISAKRKKLSVILLVTNISMLFIASILLLSYNGALAIYQTISADNFIIAFNVIVIVECVLLCMSIPGLTAPLIANERERQTLDVLLTTKMSYFEIIIGKYTSALCYVFLILITSLPFLSLTLVYGGVSFKDLICVFLTIVVMILYLTSFGVFFSTICKKTAAANILTLFVFAFLIFGTCLIVLIAYLLSINYDLYSGTTYTMRERIADALFFILYLNPAATVFDTLDLTTGFSITSTANGMAFFASSFTQNINSSGIFVRFWSLISCTLQLIVSFLMLHFSAKMLDPSRRRYHGRKNKVS